MRYGKLHLLTCVWTSLSTRHHFQTACGKDTMRVAGRLDFTNDISTMESLPTNKVCQNCLRAYRAQNTPGGKGRDE